ncbi:MAG TPA: dihydroneopterin aldolase [Ignavibacteria bacterium]
MELTKITIHKAKFYAYHGVFEYEKKYGNEFEVDIEMHCDLYKLKDTDDLKNTINYLEVYNFVKDIVYNNKFNLIETLNQNICRGILKRFEQVKRVIVKIRKPNAPLGIIDSVEIEQTLER